MAFSTTIAITLRLCTLWFSVSYLTLVLMGHKTKRLNQLTDNVTKTSEARVMQEIMVEKIVHRIKRAVDIKSFTLIIGLFSLVSGLSFLIVFKGSSLLILGLSILMIVAGLLLPYASFLAEGKTGRDGPLRNIYLCLILALVIQFSLAPFFKDLFNYKQWSAFYMKLFEGVNPYSYCFYNEIFDMFPYPPPLLLLLSIAHTASKFFGEWGFLFFIKMPSIVANILTGYIMYRMIVLSKNNFQLAKKVSCLYVFNPLLIVVTCIQGNFDPLVVFFTILAIFLVIFKDSTIISALCLGIGIAFKLYPALLLPAFLFFLQNNKKRVIFTAASAIPLLLASLPFLILDSRAYFGVVLNIGAKTGPFAIWSFLDFLWREPFIYNVYSIALLCQIITVISFGFLAFFIYNRRPTALITNNLVFLSLLYLVSPFIHENYVVWVLPFAILQLQEDEYLHLASLIVFIQMLIFTGMYGGSGLFYWTSFITGVQIATTHYINPNPLLWVAVHGSLVISFSVVCIRTLFKYTSIVNKE